MADMNKTPRFWRSPAERADAEATRIRTRGEFVGGADTPPAAPDSTLSRRRFLGLLGASAALAVSTGCSRNIDRGSIVPYTRRPEDGLPGRAVWYASSTSEGCHAFPVLVKTREARPVLIEGNDEHEDTQGALPVRQQAELLGLYDPERLQGPRQGDAEVDWATAEAALLAGLKSGSALLITQAVLSPARQALLERLRQALPGLRTASWEAAAPHGALEASRQIQGAQLLPRLYLDKARVILTLEADLFAGDGDVVRQIRGFAAGRRPNASGEVMPDQLSRLWSAESRMTLTGGKSDVRLPVRGSRLGALGFALAKALQQSGRPLPAGALPDGDLAAFAQAEGLDPALLNQLVKDLDRAGAAALVVAGSGAPPDAHAAALLLNRQLGAEGSTLEYRPAALAALTTPAEMLALGQELSQGKIDTVVLWDANPVYDGPAGLDWKAALAACKTRIRIGRLPDETAAVCEWNLAAHHWLESWGDQVGGLLQQPVVAPLFNTRQPEDLLLGVLRGLGQDVPAGMEDWLKLQWTAVHARLGSPLTFDLFWHGALHDGYVRGLTAPAAAPALNGGALAGLASPAAGEGFELALHADRRLLDGRGGNIGWLQELPDPVTKCTWGNPLTVSPADAARLGIEDGDQVKLEAAGQSLLLSALVQPGQRTGSLSLALGYGRSGLAVAEGVGVNAFPLLADGRSLLTGVQLSRVGAKLPVHTTQEHHLMEGRDLVRSLSASAYAAGATGAPSHGAHEAGEQAVPTGHDHGLKPAAEQPLSLYPDHQYKGHKWGMSIDLSACVGCAGCVLACQAENNIPVVGPERIDEGREMQWMRIDRYYEGDLENPDLVFQPMLCQHCDNAPCENVCPVAATTHNEEGLNQMTYNRCVGTRYCANNCPYKVRHFNYFDYTSELSAILQMAANPEVSIRPRGVMEKCTFCVQRINEAKNRAKSEERVLQDGDVKPACAVACAAGAIVFGDLNAESEVARLSNLDRRYKVLEELGVRPAVTYLAEVRNPVAAGGAHES
ncbi:MAG: TAT-variant-translocated molybdopterin oxidoreductase [Candidatus Delongbacteria bacterium]